MVKQESGNVAGLLQVAFILAEAVHYRKTIEAPGLSTAPGRLSVSTLPREPAGHLAGAQIVVQHMIGTVVRPEMTLNGAVGMREGDIAEAWIAALVGYPIEQFQVHHIINDHRAFKILAAVPRLDGLNGRPVSRGQGHGGRIEGGLISRIPRDAVGRTKTAVHHKSQVVVAGEVLFLLQQGQPLFCFLADSCVAGVFIDHPQAARVESAAPPLGIAVHPFVLPGIVVLRHFVGWHLLCQQFVLAGRQLHVFVDQRLHGLLRGGGSGKQKRHTQRGGQPPYMFIHGKPD